MISGSSINFWIKNTEWICYQKIKDHSSSIFGLSFNVQQNRVLCVVMINQYQEQSNKDQIMNGFQYKDYSLIIWISSMLY
ncbi:unnamed protein product [Paramecium pentaurelia]|uniref:Uncharacterized protein n=1 Tax=Paramecium pentaurelia TaxID=43138 RepID=A0A8S1W4W8_9CILI|nr:unnamed protein product [Paramecium pentaurelia]